LAAQTLERLSVTRERPLFSPTRRPPPPPPLPVVSRPELPAPPSPPTVHLFGIVVDAEGAHAIVRNGTSGPMVRVRIGDEVGGWKVSQIEGRKLVLSLDDRFATFTLFSGETSSRASTDDLHSKSAAEQQPRNQVGSQTEPKPQSTRKRQRVRQ
jgi:general secretion pathway protein N